jgi:hypothetical protein
MNVWQRLRENLAASAEIVAEHYLAVRGRTVLPRAFSGIAVGGNVAAMEGPEPRIWTLAIPRDASLIQVNGALLRPLGVHRRRAALDPAPGDYPDLEAATAFMAGDTLRYGKLDGRLHRCTAGYTPCGVSEDTVPAGTMLRWYRGGRWRSAAP